jgi:outer membrane protein insertion porin family
VRTVGVACLLALAAGLALAAEPQQKEVIGEITIVGGSTITEDTVEYYLGVAKGDVYDPEAIAKNFHRFWDSGLVESLSVEAETMSPGKIRLIVTVKERPKVTEWAFSGNKKLSTSTIREQLETANLSLKRNVPLRTSEIQRLRQGILDAYAKEGYASATVNPVTSETGPNQVKVTFDIDEGAKIKIGKIDFVGNKVYSDSKLRGALKKTKEKGPFHLWGKKIIWNKENWGEDSENLKKFYMNHGYKDIVVGEPKVQLIARNPKGTTQKEKKYFMVITIPVDEGKQFRMGSLRLKGNTVFPTESVQKLYPVKPGTIYNYSKVEQGNEALRNLYQARGYMYAYTNQSLVNDPTKPGTVDVVVDVYEGDRFRLGRLEFVGNTKTQDRVLRREVRMIEGDWMNLPLFKKSMFKINQLGYFKLKEDPVEFKFDDPNKRVNVTIKGEEAGRTDVQFGAGYSETEGLFAQASFGTRNFLGRGENIGVSAQYGGIGSAYSLSFTEPYFLDKRMMIGGSIYKQSFDYSAYSYAQSDYVRNAKGFTAMWGVSVGDFSQFAVSYGYENVEQRYSTIRSLYPGVEPTYPHRPPLLPPSKGLQGEDKFYVTYGGITSSINPSYVYNTIDDPFDPNAGLTYFGRLRLAGGILGGDFHYWRPEAGISFYHPMTRRTTVAANFDAGIIKGMRGMSIPEYDLYRIGGERSIRGFQYYSIIPRNQKTGAYFFDPSGVALGGDRFVQFNLEYQIRIAKPAKFVLFTDWGNTWNAIQGWDVTWLRYSYGVEFRIFLPVFQAPLRFIYGINPNPFPDEQHSLFQFSIGTTF